MKWCKWCRGPFTRRKAESNYAFTRRLHCSRSCQVATQNRERSQNRAGLSREAWEWAQTIIESKGETNE